MKKQKLLVSVLCLSLTVAQLPVGVFAAPVENEVEEEVIVDPAQTVSEDYLTDEIVLEETDSATDCEKTEDYVDALYGDNDVISYVNSFDYSVVFDKKTKTMTVEGAGGAYSGQVLMEPQGFEYNDVEKIVLKSTGIEKADTLFGFYENVKEIDLSGFDTSAVTDMSNMFYRCKSLKQLDLSGFKTGKVTTMEQMFCDCESLEKINLAGFDTSNVTSMFNMFEGCKSLKQLDLSGFNTSKVTTMKWMFDGCGSLEKLDISGFDTSNVTDMNGMFCECRVLKALDVSGFDTSKVTDMSSMFFGCDEVAALDVSGFKTDNVTNMEYMFYRCSKVPELDISGFNIGKVTDMGSMFGVCSSIKNLDLSMWDLSGIKLNTHFLVFCDSLQIFKTPYNNADGYYLPTTMADENNNIYLEFHNPAAELFKTTVSLTLHKVDDTGDIVKPVEVVEGGIYASGQKFVITTADCLGISYGKYVVTPKNAASVAVKTGLVTVKNAPTDGKVTITGQVKNSKGKWVDSKSFSFTAFKPAFTVKAITFTSPYDETINPDDATASVDGNTLLKDTTVMPATWTSANPKIAAVDPETGLITAVSKGSTKITAVYGDPESNNCAKYPITVKVNIPKISKTGASLLTGANLTLKLSGAPKNAAIVWTSSDPEYVSVDPSTGKVNALKFNEEAEGKAVISASVNGYTFPAYACEVSVTKPELSKNEIVIKTGKSSKITLKKTKLKVKPENVTFESTDDTKAEVDQTGKVTGKATGEVTINVTIAGVMLPCKVTVQ